MKIGSVTLTDQEIQKFEAIDRILRRAEQKGLAVKIDARGRKVVHKYERPINAGGIPLLSQ